MPTQREFNNIFAKEFSGLTPDQVYALCRRQLAQLLTDTNSSDCGATTATAAAAAAAIGAPFAAAASEEDSDEEEEEGEEEEEEEESIREQASDEEEEEEGNNDNALFKGGELDEDELAELEMEDDEEEDEEGGGGGKLGAMVDEAAIEKFMMEDLPYDKLRFGDFFDPKKVAAATDEMPDDFDDENEEEEEEGMEEEEDMEEEEEEVEQPISKKPKSKQQQQQQQHEPAVNGNKNKSKFEKSQDRLKAEIASLEDKMVQPLAWQHRGEIQAAERPEDGLLDEDLDFDSIAKPKPLASEDLEGSIQQLVLARVKEAQYDSVERKQKPEEDPVEYRKALLLNTEKPKPLADLYEEEYNKQREAMQEKRQNQPQHEEIRRDLNTLLDKLDRMSNLHFAPQNPLPEVRIISQAPALRMEEVRGTAVSDEAALAPEQLIDNQSANQGIAKGDTELTKTDKLRRRRQIKKRVKHRLQQLASRASVNKDDREVAMAQLRRMADRPGAAGAKVKILNPPVDGRRKKRRK